MGAGQELRRQVTMDLVCGACQHPQSKVTFVVPYTLEKAAWDPSVGAATLTVHAPSLTVHMECPACSRTVIHRNLPLREPKGTHGPAEGA